MSTTLEILKLREWKFVILKRDCVSQDTSTSATSATSMLNIDTSCAWLFWGWRNVRRREIKVEIGIRSQDVWGGSIARCAVVGHSQVH